jgi:argininosuccinate lyase
VNEPPPGYLGAEARITRGPAPELVAAGYELELADAALLERGLMLADIAHVIALETIPEAHRRALLDVLPSLKLEKVDSRYGDVVNARERELERRVGEAAGWLNAGRPRREAGRIAFRIALRARLLDLADAIVRFAHALTDVAARERDTPLPDYTYLQVGQPTTAGHWLLSFAYPALRDAERVLADLAWVNRSPAGAGGVNGSRFPLDRERLARLLGFSAPIVHTRDAMWQTDGFAEAAWHAALAATNASRFAEDLEIYGSDEFGLLRIGDELCRASALMPQKRNPYALVVIRGGARTLLGRATGALAAQQTPSGRTDNLLYAYGEIPAAVELATRLLNLAAAAAESLTFDPEAAERALHRGLGLATDAAEDISLRTGRPYRAAYREVGRAVAAGEALDLDPRAALATRTVTGGAAPAPMDAMLTDCRAAVAGERERVAATRRAVEAAERELLAR